MRTLQSEECRRNTHLGMAGKGDVRGGADEELCEVAVGEHSSHGSGGGSKKQEAIRVSVLALLCFRYCLLS